VLSPDIRWRTGVAEAFEEAHERGCMVIGKPLGQGMGRSDDW
jgi:hypothetical protein